MKIEVSLEGRLVVSPDSGETFDREAEIDQALDATMEELLRLDVEDPMLAGTLSDGAVRVSLTVTAPTLHEAVSSAESSIRAAFHAAGVFTDGWDDTPTALRILWHRVEADDLIDA